MSSLPRRTFVALLFLLVVQPAPLRAQSVLTGTVVEKGTEAPVPGAHVFLNETMAGTTTDSTGAFRLRTDTKGTVSFVVSMIGYETYKQKMTLKDGGKRSLDVSLAPNVYSVKGVTVEGDRSTWLKRLDRFKEEFFGAVPEADDCRLDNPEVLSFKKTREAFTAYAKGPLRVINEALGYEVIFHLNRFEVRPNRNTRYGTVEFRELEPEDEQQYEAWLEARKRAYVGSFRHFVHALLQEEVGSAGFRLKLVDRIGRVDYESARNNFVDGQRLVKPGKTESLIQFGLPGGHRFLRVVFYKEYEHPDFVRQFHPRQSARPQTTWIEVYGRVLLDRRTGDNIAPFIVVKHGYMGWAETAATALPRNYRPRSFQ